MGRHGNTSAGVQSADGFFGDTGMITTNITGPVLAAGALFAAAWSGYSTVSELTTPAIVEGAGVVDGPVYAGENTLVTWLITKRVDCPGLTSRVWHGENGFQLTEQAQVTTLDVSEAKEYRIQTRVPDLAPPGDLRLDVEGFLDCGDGKMGFSIGPVFMEVVE